LKQLLSSQQKVGIQNILIGNGSDEIIDLVQRVFGEPGQDQIIICPPTYGMYEVYANINNLDVISIPLTENFQLNTEAILAEKAKILYLCSPNNPTGNALENLEHLIKNFKGIGISKWTQLRATHELVRRSQLEQLHMQDVFSSIDMVKSFLINTIGHKDHEVFMCLYLDIHNRLLHSEEIFRGSINQTAIYIREVAKACLLRNCSNLIVAHNHPSGHLTPSKEDLAVTKTLAKSLALIEVHLLDHCIVSKNGAISMLELAILPNQASEH
jgi:DNA repair protein RadC